MILSLPLQGNGTQATAFGSVLPLVSFIRLSFHKINLLMQVKEDPEAAMNIKQAETMLGTLRFVQAVSLYHFGPTGCV